MHGADTEARHERQLEAFRLKATFDLSGLLLTGGL